MDVNLCRLPDEMKSISKFPVPLADIRWHLSSADSADILSKQPKRQFIIKKNRPLRTIDISHKRKSDVLRLLQNSLILNVISTLQSPNSASESHLHQEPQTGLTLICIAAGSVDCNFIFVISNFTAAPLLVDGT